MSEVTGKTPLLIVDDDLTIRRLLARIAQRAGFQADSAKDGAQALEMMEKKTYLIVIVDLMMPRVSGYDLVEKISKMQPRPSVIVATAMMNGDVAKIDDSLVRRVIKKPFDIEAVAKMLIDTAREIASRADDDKTTVAVVKNDGDTIIATDAKVTLGNGTVVAENATVISSDAAIVPSDTTIRTEEQAKEEESQAPPKASTS